MRIPQQLRHKPEPEPRTYRWTHAALRPCLSVLLFAALAVLSGCNSRPQNANWAAPVGTTAVQGTGAEIQAALDTYTKGLVDKNREEFASSLDPDNQAFLAGELQRFDYLADVPFAQYSLKLASESQTAPGTVIAKVDISYTLNESFSALPDPDREAYYLVRKPGGWKLSGDASEQALGKKRSAHFEDFGKVGVLIGDSSIVLYHPSATGVAAQSRQMTDAAMPKLASVFPDARLPKVAVKVYDNKDQIDRTFPGKWQEWTGGASRQLGDGESQGGEIIIDAEVFSHTNRTNPDYNQKMISHELTHITLFPLSGSRTPPFLVEGLADYVGGIEDISMLREQIRGGGFSPKLKDIYQPGSFSALLSTDAATLAYEEADSAVSLLETKYGNDKVMAMLREFQRRQGSERSQDVLVDETFRSVLGIGWSDFEAEWRSYVLNS